MSHQLTMAIISINRCLLDDQQLSYDDARHSVDTLELNGASGASGASSGGGKATLSFSSEQIACVCEALQQVNRTENTENSQSIESISTVIPNEPVDFMMIS